jgi:hypothetical protein
MTASFVDFFMGVLKKRPRRGRQSLAEQGRAEARRMRAAGRCWPRELPRLFGADGSVDIEGLQKAPLSVREFRLLLWLSYRPSESLFITAMFPDQFTGEVLQLLALRGLVEKPGDKWQLSPKGFEVLLSGGQFPTLEDLYHNRSRPRLDHPADGSESAPSST